MAVMAQMFPMKAKATRSSLSMSRPIAVKNRIWAATRTIHPNSQVRQE